MAQILSISMSDFVNNFSWWSIIDILVIITLSVVLIVFFAHRNSVRLAVISAVYALVYVAINLLVTILGRGSLQITLKVLDFLSIFLLIVFVVVYQSDFKVLINKIAHGSLEDKYNFDMTEEKLIKSASEIVKACQNMAKNDIGALIIIARNAIPGHLLDTGTELGADVSSGLLESIFSTKGPLHDGAVIIKGDKILSAACFLPLSQEVNIAKDLGTRHRAAIGITEESTVFAIVVSEETGIISVVDGGKIKRYMTPEKLFEEIKTAYGVIARPSKENRREHKFL